MTAAGESRESVRVIIRPRPDPWCSAFEAELDGAGIPIALPHRESWVSRFGPRESLVVGVVDSGGRARLGCGVNIEPLRAMPGHSVYRIERFTCAAESDSLRSVLEALVAHARTRPRVLKVVIESFAGDSGSREVLTRVAAAVGFRPGTTPRRYTRTLRLDIPLGGDAMFDALPRTARRNLRAASKSGLAVRVIDDPSFGPVLAKLEQEAFARTGGRSTATDWPRLIDYAREHPDLVRIVGIFSGSTGSASELLGFATGRAHGEHVEYASAGTTRRPGLKISIGYPLLWSLVEWAHELGAAWFDFGGITAGSATEGGDSLGGISDFKRHFGGTEIEVGDEWVLQINPVRSAVASVISQAANALRRIG